MSDTLLRLWQSTTALYERFSVAPEMENTRRVLMEEVLEFITEHVIHAVDQDNDANVTIEAADVLVTLLGALMPVTTLGAFEAAIERVIAKNNAKTLETHEVNSSGKIARKASPPIPPKPTPAQNPPSFSTSNTP